MRIEFESKRSVQHTTFRSPRDTPTVAATSSTSYRKEDKSWKLPRAECAHLVERRLRPKKVDILVEHVTSALQQGHASDSRSGEHRFVVGVSLINASCMRSTERKSCAGTAQMSVCRSTLIHRSVCIPKVFALPFFDFCGKVRVRVGISLSPQGWIISIYAGVIQDICAPIVADGLSSIRQTELDSRFTRILQAGLRGPFCKLFQEIEDHVFQSLNGSRSSVYSSSISVILILK